MSEANNLSPDAPWPGLKSYNEEDHEFFHGRDAEIHELLWLVRRNVLTIVFGPSGTGKSSLMQAGLFPVLRREGFIPDRIRLEHGGDLVEQVQRQLGLQGQTLWEGFHRLAPDWRGEAVVVFDQFEEIFTLGEGRSESERFLEELADLVENYYPKSVRDQLEAGAVLDFESDARTYHLVLVLREDFVWRLDELRHRMPAVMQTRFVLKPFNEEKAREAVEKPGKEILEAGVAEKIVAFTASPNSPRVIDPAILSLLCRELSQRRPSGSKISPDQLKGDSDSILSKFWEGSMSALDETSRRPVREFIEDRLVSPSGFRTAWPRKEMADYEPAIEKLIDGRVLRSESRFGTPHLELTHEVLCPVVSRSRMERLQRQAASEARRRMRAKWVGVIAGLCLAFAAFSLWMWFLAESSKREAVAKEVEARAREFAAYGNQSLPADPELSILLAAHAVRISTLAGAPVVSAAEGLLRRSLIESRIRATLRGHQNAVLGVAFSPDGLRLATASSDKIVKLWDAASGAQLLTLFHQGPVNSVTFSPDGRTLATASSDNTAKLWDAASGRELHTLKHESAVNSVTFSPDGRKLATASADNTGKLWDVSSERDLLTLRGHQNYVSCIAFSPDGGKLATASDDDTAKLWNASDGKVLLTLHGHVDPVTSVAFSPDGRRLATASADMTAKLWDVESGREMLVLRGFQGAVSSVVFSPDGHSLATASADKTAKVWDTATGKERLTLRGHQSGVWSVAFSPDRRSLATSGLDGTAKLWEVASGTETVQINKLNIRELLDIATHRVTRAMTDEECQRYFRGRCPR